jgi:hypothetical protein
MVSSGTMVSDSAGPRSEAGYALGCKSRVDGLATMATDQFAQVSDRFGSRALAWDRLWALLLAPETEASAVVAWEVDGSPLVAGFEKTDEPSPGSSSKPPLTSSQPKPDKRRRHTAAK